MTILFLFKIFLLAVLIFILLSYTIYLYEKTNRDCIQVKHLVSAANLWLTFRVLVVEYLTLLITLALWPFGFMTIAESQTDTNNQKPLLLLHGLFLNRSCWLVMKLRLRLQGFTDLHTIYLPPSRDIETLTERVALKIDSLRHSRNCAKVDLIGHSMGGIIARNYVQIRGGADKVDKCIVLGSPNNGSKLAPFAIMKLSEAIMPGSAFLCNLNKQPIPKKVTLTNIYSRHDNLVVPSDSAILNKSTNIELTGKGHGTLLYDNTVFQHIVSALKPAENENATNQQP